MWGGHIIVFKNIHFELKKTCGTPMWCPKLELLASSAWYPRLSCHLASLLMQELPQDAPCGGRQECISFFYIQTSVVVIVVGNCNWL